MGGDADARLGRSTIEFRQGRCAGAGVQRGLQAFDRLDQAVLAPERPGEPGEVAAWRLGPAPLFGSVENLFGLDYAGNILANESMGRFYESGSPASVSIGLSLTGRPTSDSR